MLFFPHILHIIQKSPFKTWWKNAAQKSKISKREQTLTRWWNCSRNTTSFLLEQNPWKNEPCQSKIPSLLDGKGQLSEDLPCHLHFELSSLVCFHNVFVYSIWFNASAAPNPFPMGPPRKRWYDKVADALLGDEEHDISSPSSRYALICERCFTHNGLVKESMWEDARECLSCCIHTLLILHVEFVCRNPSCNHFNRSIRSKRESSSPNSSPCSSVSPSPVTLPQSRRLSQGPSHRSHRTIHVRHNPAAPDQPSAHSSDPDAPTVDFVDTSAMEVD